MCDLDEKIINDDGEATKVPMAVQYVPGQDSGRKSKTHFPGSQKNAFLAAVLEERPQGISRRDANLAVKRYFSGIFQTHEAMKTFDLPDKVSRGTFLRILPLAGIRDSEVRLYLASIIMLDSDADVVNAARKALQKTQ